MHSSEGADDDLSAGPQPQAPLVLCSVAGPVRDALISKLMQEYPAKFGSAVRYLAGSVWIPRHPQLSGVEYSSLVDGQLWFCCLYETLCHRLWSPCVAHYSD